MDDPAPLNPQRLLVIRVLLLFTVFGGIFFGIINVQRELWPIAAAELLMAGFAGWLYFHLRYTRKQQAWMAFYLVLFFAAMLVALGTAGATLTIFVWVFLIPLLSHLLLGRRAGLWVSLGFLAVAAVIYFGRIRDQEALMDVAAIANVVVCLLAVLVLSHVYESGREQVEARLQRLATTDPLTGLPNRAAMQDALQRKCLEAGREGQVFTLALLDLDRFKQVNDRHGHEAGDRVLVGFAQKLQRIMRGSDLSARWGGEEFLVLLPVTPPEHAGQVVEKLRRETAALEFNAGAQPLSVTVSIGLASFPADGAELNELLAVADRRLYLAKAGGRDQIVGAEQEAVRA